MTQYKVAKSGFGTGAMHGRQAIADYLGISLRFARFLERHRGLPAAKICGTYWTTQSLIDAWILEHRAEMLWEREQRRAALDARTIEGEIVENE